MWPPSRSISVWRSWALTKPGTWLRTPMTSRRWTVFREVLTLRSLPADDLLSIIILSSIIGMIPKRLLLVLTVAVASFGVSASSAAPSSKHLIVSGGSEWGALTHHLVGADAKVVSLLTAPNADPHEHEAAISDAANVAKASVVLENGAGYDT